MKFRLNGEVVENENTSTLQNLIESKKLNKDYIVIELNGKIIKKEKFVSTSIQENDQLEILSFVGGG